MKRFIYLFVLIIALFVSCDKDQYSYKKFIGGNEIVYAGLAEQIITRSGNLRVQIEWKKSIDPSVETYMLYWNNNKDSASVSSTDIDADSTYRYIITGLPEYVQGFRIETVNDRGGRSIGQDINSVRVFGPYYQSSLINRKLNDLKYFDTDSVRLYFLPVDSTVVYSKLRYRRSDGGADSIRFMEDSVTLPSYMVGSKPTIQSYYLPEATAIDTFATLVADSLQVL